MYDDPIMTVDGVSLATRTAGNSEVASALIAPGHTANLRLGYRSRGLDSFPYLRMTPRHFLVSLRPNRFGRRTATAFHFAG